MRIVVNIDVPDLKAGANFYEAAVGLRLARILDDDVAELVGASSVVYLLQKHEGSAANAGSTVARDYRRHWTPVHVDFVVDDLADAARRALAAGARQESECVEWRGSKCITFADPFGNGFCLIEFAAGTYE
jgi:predicted enzyme related to lactoylglutathione lyase